MNLSLEFFPSNNGDSKKILNAYDQLSFLEPRFVSVTYGALGSDQDKSIDLATALNNKNIETAAHLTIANKSIKDIEVIVDKFMKKGIKKIVALRGDCPNNNFREHPDGFLNTSEFVNFLVNRGLEVFVSSYPEHHPDSESFDVDLALLKDKQNAGASKAITQFCFSKDAYAKLLDESSKKDIDIEITPGIMPIYNINSILNMSQKCGIKIPDIIKDRFGENESDNFKQALEICHEQLDYLNELGYKSLHFYTLNRHKFLKQLFSERALINKEIK